MATRRTLALFGVLLFVGAAFGSLGAVFGAASRPTEAEARGVRADAADRVIGVAFQRGFAEGRRRGRAAGTLDGRRRGSRAGWAAGRHRRAEAERTLPSSIHVVPCADGGCSETVGQRQAGPD